MDATSAVRDPPSPNAGHQDPTGAGAQHWLQLLLATLSVATVLLPITGIVYFQFAHVAIRSLPSELVAGTPIAELGLSGLYPTLNALFFGAVFYTLVRSSQLMTRADAQIQASKQDARAAGVSAESAAALEADMQAVFAELDDQDRQRREITAGLAGAKLPVAQARTRSAAIETRQTELIEKLHAIKTRSLEMSAVADRVVAAIDNADRTTDQFLIVRSAKRLSPILNRLPLPMAAVRHPWILLLLLFVPLLVFLPLVYVLVLAVLNLVTQWMAGKQPRTQEPLTVARTIPFVLVMLFVTSAALGLTAGPSRLADVTFDPLTGLTNATFGYLGSTGQATYLLDCSGEDRVLAVPHDRVTMFFHPRPPDTSPTLWRWIQDTSQSLLPFIGPTCGSTPPP